MRTHLIFFFFNDTATTEIYTLSLHDALPICPLAPERHVRDLDRAALRAVDLVHPVDDRVVGVAVRLEARRREDRKSTRLNSSHANISYAVFCLKKKDLIEYSHDMILRSHTTT